jgi:cysteine desulfurase
VSTGSACHGGEEQPSHVLLAMGILEASAKSTIRISFGDANSMADIEKTIKVLKYGLAKIHRQQ